jgi:predicted membrane channel-forming protein YqfA (hemolysin III family)
MNLAASPKQFLPMAKRLKRCFQIRNIVCLTLLFCLPLMTLDDFHDVSRLVILLIVYVIGALFSNKDFWIDITFCEDMDELEYRLEE